MMKKCQKESCVNVRLTTIFLCLCGFAVSQSDAGLEQTYAWRYIDFAFDTVDDRTNTLGNKTFIVTSNLLVDVDVSSEGKIFLTLERIDGVPASLATLVPDTEGYGGGPMLRAYPDWSWANIGNCDNLIGVYRIAMDDCNRLWVIDSGIMNDILVCPPKLLAFNASSDELIAKEILPDDVVFGENGETRFLNIVVDTVGSTCSDTNVYMADSGGYGLVVWNRRFFWRVESPYFYPESNAVVFNVEGDESVTLSRGLLGMSVVRDENDVMKRQLYFRPLSSYALYNVHVVDLHRYKYAQSQIAYEKEPSELYGQSIAQAFSNKGILFYSSVSNNAILCWNRKNPFQPENTAIIAMNDMTLQWASGIKVIASTDKDDETLWVLTNRWQRFYNQDMDPTQINFRILIGNVTELVNGTVCQ